MSFKVLMASNQVRGLDGTGGLGDVPVALAKEFNKGRQVEARLIMPGFPEISGSKKAPALENRFQTGNQVVELRAPFGNDTLPVTVYKVAVPKAGGGLVCYLLRNDQVFGQRMGEGLAINKDTPDKAILFAHSVVLLARHLRETPEKEGFPPDLIHCNDWHCGLVPAYLASRYGDDPLLKGLATTFTTHNAGHGFRGDFDGHEHLLYLAGLQGRGLYQPGWGRSVEHQGRFCFTKAGLAFSQRGNTVSITYRKELGDGAGGGLEGFLTDRWDKFQGILNGLDQEEWDPEHDPVLKEHNANFAAGNALKSIRQKKKRLRAALRRWTPGKPGEEGGERPFACLEPDALVAVFVGRIDRQKAPYLAESADLLPAKAHGRKVQYLILGSPHPDDAKGKGYMGRLVRKSCDNPATWMVFNGYNEDLSHLLYGAADLFLMPSAFEPCGLTQMTAMRYGAPPLVRRVGGLVDTVIDAGHPLFKKAANGFAYDASPFYREEKFDENPLHMRAEALALRDTLQGALDTLCNRRKTWERLVRNGMRQDFGWREPAGQYLEMFLKAIEDKKAE